MKIYTYFKHSYYKAYAIAYVRAHNVGFRFIKTAFVVCARYSLLSLKIRLLFNNIQTQSPTWTPKTYSPEPLIIIFCIPLDCKISYSIVVPDENDSISEFLDWLRGTGNGRRDCSGADLHVIYFKNTFNAYKTARGQINM